MALGDPYVTAAQLKTRLGIGDTVDDTAAGEAVLAGSRAIEEACGRQFNVGSSATARLFYPGSVTFAEVPDISSTTGLVIQTDTAGDGTYATTWIAADYQLEPLDGWSGPESGWPYTGIRAVSTQRFIVAPSPSTRAPLKVTAKWGWAAVPAPVLSASYLMSADYLALKDARFGLSAGYGDWGPWRVSQNKAVTAMLHPYMLHPVMVA